MFKHIVLSYLLLDLSSRISYFYAYCFYISLFNCFLIQYENTIYFSIFVLFFILLPNSPFIFSSFFFIFHHIFYKDFMFSEKKKNDSFTSSFPKQVLFIYFLAILQSLEYNVEQKWWKLYPWTVFWKEEIIHNFTMHDVICNASQIRLWVENLLMLDCKSTHIGFCQVVFLCLLRWYVFFS